MAPTRTSFSQFMLMVDFMERNGDLSKVSGGSRERHLYVKKWQELTEKLNSDRGGRKGTEEKWRKAWSDLKNNTKRKWLKMTTGDSQSPKIIFTSLEHRVLAFIGIEAPAGIPTPQVGINQVEKIAKPIVDSHRDSPKKLISYDIDDKDWNSPSTSTDPTVSKRSPPITPSSSPRSSPPANMPPISNSHQPIIEPPPKRRRMQADEIFPRCEGDDVIDYFKERERVQMELERERIRQKGVELQQKREEIQLKGQFIELMKEALKLFAKCLEEKNDE